VITPTQAAIADTLASIDQVLTDHDRLTADALPLVADDARSVKALERRGITVPT
jgi:hypothetical protein